MSEIYSEGYIEMRDKIKAFIKDYYNERHEEVIITKKISGKLLDVLHDEHEEWVFLSDDEQRACCGELLDRGYIRNYVINCQPQISKVPNVVMDDIKKYFAVKLPDYNVVEVSRRSNHKEDSYLYMVIAQNTNGGFACWSSWNESIKSLNNGHYGLQDMESAAEILKQNFHDITGEMDKYGREQSSVSAASCQPVEVQQQQIETEVVQRRHRGR